MNTRKAYMQTIDVELDVGQEKFARFKAQGMAFTTRARIKHSECVVDLEKKFYATKAKLRELGEADEHVWELLTDGVEDMWGTLQSTLEKDVAIFKEEHV
jgi:hypothetical protein